ncbi:ribulose-phosphate 3-epimerase [Aceticella autotrophica]|uniref:Ribulose-phosphate 3-epimerase n=1 Tax=Aceticella autotrophica TaxID=2755338 RepID=A0A975AUH3_9THEO|nr:ribulose-phosphate 3-epimerase [Aceticella autotrophica]QSZ26668.1 ribulose-phosphate 3-epimerase [Aceticella autotrophica]
MKIAPSILSADFGCLIEDIKKIERAGADLLHIDVMDGHFVPNITIGPGVIRSLKNRVSIPFDVHLMIDEPEKYINEFVKAGADIITVHQEACIHLNRVIQIIKDCGIKAGVALNPSTPVEMLEYVLSDIDMVLLMTVNPGFGGQKFIDSMIDKISDLNSTKKNKPFKFEIEVDGGISKSNIKIVTDAGADIIVAGSSIFGTEDPKKAIYELREANKK